jgi:hypothetical protein
MFTKRFVAVAINHEVCINGRKPSGREPCLDGYIGLAAEHQLSREEKADLNYAVRIVQGHVRRIHAKVQLLHMTSLVVKRQFG